MVKLRCEAMKALSLREAVRGKEEAIRIRGDSLLNAIPRGE